MLIAETYVDNLITSHFKKLILGKTHLKKVLKEVLSAVGRRRKQNASISGVSLIDF